MKVERTGLCCLAIVIVLRADQIYSLGEPNYAPLIEHVCRLLREAHGQVIVARPVGAAAIDDLTDALLHELVRRSLVCALGHGLGAVPVLSAFIVTRFVAAPNFTEHPAARAWLEDSRLGPDDRFRKLIERLEPRDWREIRRSYRAEGWLS